MRHALVAIPLLLLAPLPVAAADTHLCMPYELDDIVAVRCEANEGANGATQRATEVEVELRELFIVRARFSETTTENGTSSRCSVYYHSLGAPGPMSVEWGSACVYPLSLP